MSDSEGEQTPKAMMKSVVQMKKDEYRHSNAESESENDEDSRERDWRKRTDHNTREDYGAENKKRYSEEEEDKSDERKRRRSDSDDVSDDKQEDRDGDRYSDDEERAEAQIKEKTEAKEKEAAKLKRREERFRAKEGCDDRKRKADREKSPDVDNDKPAAEPVKKKEKKEKSIEDIFTKAGGAYIPPSKLREMQASITDKTSAAYQRMSWEALKKSINGLVNKVNISNLGFVVGEILHENIIRGRGVLCQSIMRAQVASPTFTHVYAALVSIINTKFPKIGELLIRRLIIQFRKSFKRNDKNVCINTVKFIAHLVNQEVVHELLALEVLSLLLQNPSGDSCEVAISFLKEAGQKLTELSPRGINAVFDTLRRILHDSDTDRRTQYTIEVMFAVRKDGFKEYPIIMEGLDLVEEDDQVTHLIRLEEKITGDDLLNVFKVDPNFAENEEKYKQIKSDLLGSGDEDSDEEGSGDESGSDDDSDEDDQEQEKPETEKMEIIDKTETNLVALRRLIYLTIQSSLDYEECAHKMMKLNIKPGQEHEFCFMVVECCSQQRSYEKFFGLLGQRFCLLRKEFMEQYMVIFKEQYEACHQLETNKLRNTAKLFGHLLHSDAMPWTVLAAIQLNEDDTTSSSRIFIKILFQDLVEYLGIKKLKLRINDPIIASYVEGVFPRDDPRNTRFSINFFTAIGLGGLTDELRAHLKTMPKVPVVQQQQQAEEGDSSSSSSSDSDSSSDSNSSSSSDESSGDDRRQRKKTKDNKRRKDSEREREVEKTRRRESRRNGSTERSKRRESHDRSKRRDSPDRPRRRDSPDNRQRRRESPDERSRHRESQDRSRKRDESPERSHRQRESPEPSRRRDSPDRKSRNEHSRKHHSPDGKKNKDSYKSEKRYQKYSSRHSNRSVSRER